MPFNIYSLLSYQKKNKKLLQTGFTFLLSPKKRKKKSLNIFKSLMFSAIRAFSIFFQVTFFWIRLNIRLILVFFFPEPGPGFLFFHDPFTWKPINIISCKHSTTWQTITPNRPQSILQGSSYKKSLNSEWSLYHLRINQKDNIFLGSKTAPSISNLSIKKMTNWNADEHTCLFIGVKG